MRRAMRPRVRGLPRPCRESMPPASSRPRARNIRPVYSAHCQVEMVFWILYLLPSFMVTVPVKVWGRVAA